MTLFRFPADGHFVTYFAPEYYNVFVGGPHHNEDLSEVSIIRVLPQVIEATNRVLVSNGDYDFNVIRNGTLMTIQNMTWNENLGFQSRPEKSVVITLPDLRWDGVPSQNGVPSSISSGFLQGVMGIQHYERGLMWMQTSQCGHMQAQYQPRVAYRHLQWMLGHVDSL
ncbi:Serine carboxypeptidase [Aspergillus sp. HF37]|nr:Serine carboxypeptidase [Aspergillus sp. HF37]